MTRQLMLLTCTATLLFLTATTAAQRDTRRRPVVRAGIAVFEDENFGGRSRTFNVDVPNLNRSGFNDRVSSIVVADGEVWEVCVDPNYGGRCTTITNWEANLNDTGWNDRLSSIRRIRISAGRGRFGRGGGDFSTGDRLGAARLVLYSGTNYTGSRKEIVEAVRNFSSIDFNDRARSLRVVGYGPWEVCVGANYDDCRVVTDDVPDLRAIGVERVISSARPRPNGPGFRRR